MALVWKYDLFLSVFNSAYPSWYDLKIPNIVCSADNLLIYAEHSFVFLHKVMKNGR